jgi:predicted amidohydrolase
VRTSLRISLVQISPMLGNKDSNLSQIYNSMLEAKNQQSDLVVFPELFLTGYDVGKNLNNFAETIEGSSINKIKVMCKDHSIYSIVGFPEIDEKHNYYISSAVIDNQGNLVGSYRKTHLFDKEKFYFKKGEEFKVFHTKIGKIGIMICYDLEFPEVARSLKLMGAEIIIVLTANMSPYEEYQNVYMRSRAMENEIPIVICNRLGNEGEMSFFGDSMVVDGKGKVLYHMGRSPGIGTVTLPSSTTLDLKLNYIKNRRPDIYSEY